MHRRWSWLGGLLAFAVTAAAQENPLPAPPTQPGFHPPGMWTWDNWFVRDGDRWHAFYLQLPQAVGQARRWKDNDFYKHVGHAISTDLRTWQDQGPALCALSGTWNDRHIATGSVIRHRGRWWMAFTGRGTKGDGVGLAVSDDLNQWQPAQDQPLFPLTGTFSGGIDSGTFSSPWRDGTTRRWIGISDPYLFEEPTHGWIYLILCSRILDVPIAQSGCLTMLRSRDLRKWEAPTIIAWPGCFERMETPQLWPHQDRWYLSFGGVLNPAWIRDHQAELPPVVQGKVSHLNYCYRLSHPAGPASEEDLQHIEIPRSHYIMKVLPQTTEQDVAIFTVKEKNDSSISQPYPVEYTPDGALRLIGP